MLRSVVWPIRGCSVAVSTALEPMMMGVEMSPGGPPGTAASSTIGTRQVPLVAVTPPGEAFALDDVSVCAKEAWTRVHASMAAPRMVFIRFNGPSDRTVCFGGEGNGGRRNSGGRRFVPAAAERLSRFRFGIEPHDLHIECACHR